MTSKDDRLADCLAASGAETIILSFVEGEAIVGPLPILARRSMEWWGATPFGRYANPHALGWWHAGYVARPSRLRRPNRHLPASGAVTVCREIL